MTVDRTAAGPGNRIEAEARRAMMPATARPSARGLIETAAAMMHEVLAANPLIALLDAEGLGSQLSDGDRDAVLTIVRSLEAGAPLPQRQPGSTGAQPAQRL